MPPILSHPERSLAEAQSKDLHLSLKCHLERRGPQRGPAVEEPAVLFFLAAICSTQKPTAAHRNPSPQTPASPTAYWPAAARTPLPCPHTRQKAHPHLRQTGTHRAARPHTCL